MIYNLMTIEITMKKKEPSILTKNFMNCRYIKKIQKLKLNDVMMDFDATSLYRSANWDEKSFYPKIETGFAFKPHMNQTYVEAFNNQTFIEDGNESAILRTKYYNPHNLIFQHLPVKEKVKNFEVYRMRKRYIVDILTFVNIQEIVKIGGKVIEIWEGITYREHYKVSPFRKDIEKLFALRQNYKFEQNDLMQGLVKVILNNLYGVQIRKDTNESYQGKFQH